MVDEGSRANYGLSWTLYGFEGMRASAFVGQSYQFYRDKTFGEGTGLEDNVSDIVSAIDLSPAPWFDLLYRNRIDHASFDFRRNELTALVGGDAARFGTTYVRYDGQPQNQLQGSEEVQYTVDMRLTRLWRTRFFGVTDLQADTQREIGVRLIYEDECLFFSTQLARRNYRDRDLKPSDSVFFRLGFKTLGDVGVGF